jgi:hypothetical protein
MEEVMDTEYWEDKDSMNRMKMGTESKKMGFMMEEVMD